MRANEPSKLLGYIYSITVATIQWTILTGRKKIRRGIQVSFDHTLPAKSASVHTPASEISTTKGRLVIIFVAGEQVDSRDDIDDIKREPSSTVKPRICLTALPNEGW